MSASYIYIYTTSDGSDEDDRRLNRSASIDFSKYQEGKVTQLLKEQHARLL